MAKEPSRHAVDREPSEVTVDYVTPNTDTSDTPIFGELATEMGVRVVAR